MNNEENALYWFMTIKVSVRHYVGVLHWQDFNVQWGSIFYPMVKKQKNKRQGAESHDALQSAVTYSLPSAPSSEK